MVVAFDSVRDLFHNFFGSGLGSRSGFKDQEAMKSRILIAAVGAFGLLMAGSASACWPGGCTPPPSPTPPTCGSGTSCIGNNPTGEYVWDFTDSSSSVSGPYADINGSGVQVQSVTAWQNPGSNGGGSLYQTNQLYRYDGGLGVGPTNSYPEHAVDNKGAIDSILLVFSEAVTLSQVAFGWERDFDFTLAAYTADDGASNNPNLAGQTYDQLLASGWTAASYYGNGSYYDSSAAEVTSVNNGGALNQVSSSYWLISALNNKLGGTQDNYYDYFKLCAVSADKGSSTQPPASIPEPSVVSLFLMGLLLAGYLRVRNNGSRELMTLKA